MRVVRARPNYRKSYMRRPCTKKDASAEQQDLAKMCTSSRIANKAPFYTPVEAKVMPAPTSKRPEEREFVVDSGE